MPDTQDDFEPRVRRIISRWGHDPGALVQVLREVQEAFGYLPAPVLTLVARLLRIPYSRAKGVASFYSFLSDEPLGAYRVLKSLAGRPGQRRAHVVHRHVRPGAGIAGQRPRRPVADQ